MYVYRLLTRVSIKLRPNAYAYANANANVYPMHAA